MKTFLRDVRSISELMTAIGGIPFDAKEHHKTTSFGFNIPAEKNEILLRGNIAMQIMKIA